MDYKRILRKRSLRIKLLHLLDFMPDEWMLRLQYRIKTGRKLNLANPQRFTEKLQWYKLYYRDALMAKCVDKLSVRDYVADQGFADILVSLLGAYDNAEDIDWDILPQQFVLKDTLGGGGNSVIICNDKSQADLADYRRRAAVWLDSYGGRHPGREWVYEGSRNRLLVENILPSNPQEGGLIDYKFFCFNGHCSYMYVIADRIPGVSGGLGIFSADFNQLPVCRADERPLERQVERPANYADLLQVAEKLAAPFPEVRVDLYDIDGHIYFGEMTFFDGSGYMPFNPDSFDIELGTAFVLPERNY